MIEGVDEVEVEVDISSEKTGTSLLTVCGVSWTSSVVTETSEEYEGSSDGREGGGVEGGGGGGVLIKTND